MNPYRNFVITLLLSFVIMYAVMFTNVDSVSHIELSLTRAYMALLMVTPMAIIMLLMMKSMYPDTRKNNLIILASAVVFIAAFLCLRTQTPIRDVQYMKAMIPHHSSAIMTSKHATIHDPEVRKLADSIIASQEREITQMKQILDRMK